MIKVALFDIDGVIVPEGRLYFRGRLLKQYQVPIEKTAEFFLHGFNLCLTGQADLKTELSKHLTSWGWRGSVEDLLDFWFSEEKKTDGRILRVIKALREEGIKCYIASNQEKHRAEYLMDTVGLRDCFDSTFFSHELGLLKKDRSFFKKVLAALENIDPSEILFIDDNAQNIFVAETLGISTAYFTTYENFRDDLYAMGLLREGLPQVIKPVIPEVDVIRTLTGALFHREPVSIEQIAMGNINRVFSVRLRSMEDVIVRLNPNMFRVPFFERAQWAAAEARQRTIPAPDILHIGNTLVPYAYSVYTKIPGIAAEAYQGDRHIIWHELGKYAKLINSIAVPGYGRCKSVEEGDPSSYQHWHEYIAKEIKGFLEIHRSVLESAVTKEQIEMFEKILHEIYEWKFEPRLIHGDLSLKNVLVNEQGDIRGILDWDDAIFARAPHHEIATTFAWMVDADNETYKQEFLAGYGIDKEQWRTMEREVTMLQIMLYFEVLIWYNHIKNAAGVTDMHGWISRTFERFKDM